ncbi:uncharacterized protein TEOVI_000192100 [Trypanosoma equiperdum]|uniref:Uncharacterized protein n=1 Tax=Trypanosoma equiperdum TaxID=5694 RepID=A0A1G4IDL1_TRYEQ|nr:hypothetical protein, conserved [Trypanosoma equiperdum]
MRCARFYLIQWGHTVAAGTAAPPRRKRQFNMKEGVREPRPPRSTEVSASPATVSTPYRSPRGLTRPLSQREEYRAFQQQQQEALCNRGIPGEWMTPLPSRVGIDEHGYEAPRVTKEERRTMLQQALERNAASVVEFTDGGESDIETHGMSSSDFHSRDGWTTIPKESALYSNICARDELQSRARHNSWSLSHLRGHERETGNLATPGSSAESMDKDCVSVASEDVIDASRRRRHQDEGSYTNVLGGDLLEPNFESIGQPRSTYGMRKLFVAGLTGYEGMITKGEEALICGELMLLLQDRRAAYIAEETRYCVNLYEKELGIPGKDTLAFAMDRAPTLQAVLERFFHLGIIPSLPNICQVNEMIGNFSGYPVHKKPHTVGPYVGIMNLVSTTVMHMQHVDSPWFPRIHMSPRSLFIVEQPCLGEYKMGYKQTHQPFHAFEYATRVSKDYRIEVMFATVEVSHMRCLREAVGLTDYARVKQLDGGGSDGVPRRQEPQLTETASSKSCVTRSGEENDMSLFVGSADRWIERLQRQLHAAEVDNRGSSGRETASVQGPCHDGNLLREQLLATGSIGSKSRPFETSNAAEEEGRGAAAENGGGANQSRRRIMALKARYELAKKLREERGPEVSSGMRVIKGHSPLEKPRL